MLKVAEPWSLTSLREKLIKIGAKAVIDGRYVPDCRGRGAEKIVCGDSAVDRPAAAKTVPRVGTGKVGCDISMGELCQDEGEMARSAPSITD